MNISEIIKLMRPHQWIKNLFLFLPMFFGNRMFDGECLLSVSIAFAAFSLLSSSVYCFNDIQDYALDKLHPEKRLRPLASGKVSVKQAYMSMIFLATAAFGILAFLGIPKALYIALLYYVINLLYCIKLKNIALVDIFIVSFGFVLRIFIGGAASGVELSMWIILMTFLLSLFIAFSKRLDDARIFMNKKVALRRNISGYSPDFILFSLSTICAITIVCYIMYTIDDEVKQRVSGEYLYITSLFVLLGMLRFMQFAVVKMNSSSPTKILLKDRFIQICILLWILSFSVLLYM